MANAHLRIDSAQYLTSSSSATLITGTISFTYSYSRFRGNPETILFNALTTGRSAMITGTSVTSASRATSSLFLSISVGTVSATGGGGVTASNTFITGIGGGTNSHGPLVAGNYALTLSLPRVTSLPYILSVS